MTHLQFMDFFAGVGLAELGLVPPWVCVWANDIDPKKKAIYDANFDGERYLLKNVEAVELADLPAPVDMAWASFPCQDLSLAGWRRGLSATRSGTFWAFHRLMRELHERGQRPPVIVIENVTGLLYGPDFTGLCEALAALGDGGTYRRQVNRSNPLRISSRTFLPTSTGIRPKRRRDCWT